jgi:hypothetical protein
LSEGATIDATAKDPNGKRFSAKYNFGDITIAGDYIQTQGNNLTNAVATRTSRDVELTGKSAGIAYAINKDVSIGYTRSKAEASVGTVKDETVNHYAIGYNLGAVSATLQYRDVEGAMGESNTTGEGEILSLKLSTRF